MENTSDQGDAQEIIEDRSAITHRLSNLVNLCANEDELRHLIISELLPLFDSDIAIVSYIGVNVECNASIQQHAYTVCLPETEGLCSCDCSAHKIFLELSKSNDKTVMVHDKDSLQRILKHYTKTSTCNINDCTAFNAINSCMIAIDRLQPAVGIMFCKFQPNETIHDVKQMEMLQPSLLNAVRAFAFVKHVSKDDRIIEYLIDSPNPICIIDDRYIIQKQNAAFKKIHIEETGGALLSSMLTEVQRITTKIKEEECAEKRTEYAHTIILDSDMYSLSVAPVSEYNDPMWLLRLTPIIDQHNVFDQHLIAMGLTKKEIQICAMLAKGVSKQDVMRINNFGQNTLKTHMKHIYDKLDVHDHVKLIHLLVRLNDPDERKAR